MKNTRVRKRTDRDKKEQHDIIIIDEKIKKLFQEYKQNVNLNKKKLKDINKKLEDCKHLSYKEILKLQENKKKYEYEIEAGEDINIFSEYLMLTQKILTKYSEIIKKPIKTTFIKQKKNDNSDNEIKNELIIQFLDIAKKYIPIIIPIEDNNQDKCNCNGIEFKLINDYTKVCKNCGVMTSIMSSQTQYKDAERINMNQKYKYGMKVHFKDTLNQFQGKQNKYIDKKVYEHLETTFKRHGLVNEILPIEENGKNIDHIDDPVKLRHLKYSRITKDYIQLFLSEIGCNKNYEDINLLHYYYTGIPCHDLSKYEESLLKDFELIESAFKSLPPEYCDRLNGLNNQYILLQLLKRHKYKCNENDFKLLKTIDKKIEHDEIYEQICNKLEWQFIPLF